MIWPGAYLIWESYNTLHQLGTSFIKVFRVGTFLGIPWTVSYFEASLTQSDFSTSWDLLKTHTCFRMYRLQTFEVARQTVIDGMLC